MSHIGDYVSISATNAGAIIDALTAQLREAQSMKDYYCGQVVHLTAETEAQAAEIKRMEGELEKGKQDDQEGKFAVGDAVINGSGMPGKIIERRSAYVSNARYLVEYGHGYTDWQTEGFLSPAPSEAPDAALS